jgi:hypothetical protein
MTWFIRSSVYRPTPTLTARHILEILHWRTGPAPDRLPLADPDSAGANHDA